MNYFFHKLQRLTVEKTLSGELLGTNIEQISFGIAKQKICSIINHDENKLS